MSEFAQHQGTRFTASVALCNQFQAHLNTVQTALEQLAQRGMTPRQISLSGDRPVIVIDPPADEHWIQAAMRRRVPSAHSTRTVLAAPFHGCRLEWECITSRSH